MSREVGVLRSEQSLGTAASALDSLTERMDVDVEPGRASWEATNLLTIASAMVDSARRRTESRGCHRRTDHPEPDDAWLRHLAVTLGADGRITIDDRS